VTGLVGILCLFFAVAGTNFPKGAGLFPMLVGSLGVVAAFLCLFWQLGNAGPKGEKEHFDKSTLWAVGMTFMYPLLVSLLGYIAGTLSFVLTMISAKKRNLRALLSFAALVLGLWLVFAKVLLLRLPSGIVWQLFS
jgi:ABC-type spermidine/putrescine transport system permease subunit II